MRFYMRFYNFTDHRQCEAVDDQGLGCAGLEGHEPPHAYHHPYTEPIEHHQPPCTSQQECFRRVIEDARKVVSSESAKELLEGAAGAEFEAYDRVEDPTCLGPNMDCGRKLPCPDHPQLAQHGRSDGGDAAIDPDPETAADITYLREQHKGHYGVPPDGIGKRAVELVFRASDVAPIGDEEFFGLLGQLLMNPDNHKTIVVWIETMERKVAARRNYRPDQDAEDAAAFDRGFMKEHRRVADTENAPGSPA
jgi:hypothetical protein